MSEQQQAGRDLDALIERRVFGGSPVQRAVWESPDCIYDYTNDPERRDTDLDWVRLDEQGRVTERVPAYSADIAAAWQVRRKMTELGFLVSIDDAIGRTETMVPFFPWVLDPIHGKQDYGQAKVPIGQEPLGICLAALKVVGQK